MYASWTNQFAQLIRFMTAALTLYVVVPRLAWPDSHSSSTDRFWQGFVRIVALTIALVYCLVLSGLYEVPSFALCLLLYLFRRRFSRSERRRLWLQMSSRLSLSMYDLLDGLVHPKQHLSRIGRFLTKRLREFLTSCGRSLSGTVSTLLLVGVLGYSAALRFHDAVMHAAPAMSDAYVTLAWMKYIERRILFHDGIYPQGFHIVLSTLHKLAGQDALYTLKYAGPLCGVLTVFGVYYFVWKFTGQKSAGLVAALAYGTLGGWLPLEWERQASTNSQEFALIFLLPAWHWSHRFLTDARRADWWSAFACYAIIGWVHVLVFALLMLGLICLGLAHLLTRWRDALPRAPSLIGAASASGLLAVLPLGLGLIWGRPFHQSSLEFATSMLAISTPVVTWMDLLPLTGIAAFLLLAVGRRDSDKIVTAVFLTLLGTVAFALYLLAGPLTGNAILVTRGNLLWSMMIAVGCGTVWAAVWSVISHWQRRRLPADVAAAALVCCLSLLVLKPQPPEPYKMQTDTMVEQHLRISSQFRPTEWMIVSSDESYALVLGQGYHMHSGDWLQTYPPTAKQLQTASGAELMLTPDIFLFREKVIFKTGFEHLVPVYERREAESHQMRRWLAAYDSTHDNLSLFHEDETLEVWRINQADWLEARRVLAGRNP